MSFITKRPSPNCLRLKVSVKLKGRLSSVLNREREGEGGEGEGGRGRGRKREGERERGREREGEREREREGEGEREREREREREINQSSCIYNQYVKHNISKQKAPHS